MMAHGGTEYKIHINISIINGQRGTYRKRVGNSLLALLKVADPILHDEFVARTDTSTDTCCGITFGELRICVI